MEIITITLIGISLSIDAFSLSLAYGLLNINHKQIISITFFVGLFHFFMPLLGNTLGSLITNYININPKYILSTILLLIVIEMFKSINEKKEEYILKFLNIIFFAFLVSLDSFTVGIGLSFISQKHIISSIIFSITSAIFTYSGFRLGKHLSKSVEKTAKIIGIAIMLTLILYFLCKG